MRKFPRFVSKQLGRLIPVNTLLKITTPTFHPFYHVVSNKKLPHILNYNYRNVNEFEKELDFYLKHFKAVSLDYILKNPKTTKKIFHLSFDDGLKECAEIIAPILLKKGIPATFFVNSGFADNRALFHKYKASLILKELVITPNSEAEKILNENQLQGKYILNATIRQVELLDKVAKIIGIDFTDFLKKQKPYLTTNQIINLKEQGFSIGAHSKNHPEFWEISEKEQITEVKRSMNWITEKINPSIKTFSFPFTDSGVSSKVIRTIVNENICDITFGTAGLKYDELKNHFQRYPAEQSGDFIQNIKSEWIYFELRKRIGKATVKH